jgi:hypothetical protein|tara:strand:- start:152 stop:463 length:312 start_codon:yes stop_codon:yes gene_type:complete
MKNISKEMLEISIQENLFTYNNKIYERLYNHEYKYRFFIKNNTDYDYVEDTSLIIELDEFLTFRNLILHIKKFLPYDKNQCEDKYIETVMDYIYSEIKQELIK